MRPRRASETCVGGAPDATVGDRMTDPSDDQDASVPTPAAGDDGEAMPEEGSGTVPLSDADIRDALPEDLDAAGYVGPYLFPNNNRRRIPALPVLGDLRPSPSSCGSCVGTTTRCW